MTQEQTMEVYFGFRILCWAAVLIGLLSIRKNMKDDTIGGDFVGWALFLIGIAFMLPLNTAYESEKLKLEEAEKIKALNEDLKIKNVYLDNVELPEDAISAEIILEKGYAYVITDDSIYIYK